MCSGPISMLNAISSSRLSFGRETRLGRIVKTAAISRSLVNLSPLARVAFALIRWAEPSALRRFRVAQYTTCYLMADLYRRHSSSRYAFPSSAYSVATRHAKDSLSANRRITSSKVASASSVPIQSDEYEPFSTRACATNSRRTGVSLSPNRLTTSSKVASASSVRSSLTSMNPFSTRACATNSRRTGVSLSPNRRITSSKVASASSSRSKSPSTHPLPKRAGATDSERTGVSLSPNRRTTRHR